MVDKNIQNNSNPFLYCNLLMNENNKNKNLNRNNDKKSISFENNLSLRKKKHYDINDENEKNLYEIHLKDKIFDSNIYSHYKSSPEK